MSNEHPATPVAPLLLFPGETTPPMSLTALLREAHEGAAAARLIEIERRTKNRIPLDDSTVWADVAAAVVSFAGDVAANRSTAVRKTAQRVLDITAEPLEPLPDFVPPAADVHLVLRTVSARDLSRFATRRVFASKKWRDAGDDAEKLIDANDLWRAAIDQLVRASVVEIRGLRRVGADAAAITDLTDAVLDGLDKVGLLSSIHEACLHFQGLPPGKVELSGSSLQST